MDTSSNVTNTIHAILQMLGAGRLYDCMRRTRVTQIVTLAFIMRGTAQDAIFCQHAVCH